MNITMKQVFKHFLNEYLKTHAHGLSVKAGSFFKNFFLRDELMLMIQHSYDGVASQSFDIASSNNTELLSLLTNEDILSYYLNSWEKPLDTSPLVNPDMLYDALEQLGNQSSYLAEKDVLNWDAYDHSNYRSLLLKARKFHYVFGLYDKEMNEEQAQKMNPINNRFFANKNEIKQALIENENLSGKRVHAILTTN